MKAVAHETAISAVDAAQPPIAACPEEAAVRSGSCVRQGADNLLCSLLLSHLNLTHSRCVSETNSVPPVSAPCLSRSPPNPPVYCFVEFQPRLAFTLQHTTHCSRQRSFSNKCALSPPLLSLIRVYARARGPERSPLPSLSLAYTYSTQTKETHTHTHTHITQHSLTREDESERTNESEC